MSTRPKLTVDANEGVANVAYRLNEVMAIYPITPSSPMAEFCDQWASENRKNLWGTIPSIVALQSEGGAVAACTARCRPARSPPHSQRRRACC